MILILPVLGFEIVSTFFELFLTFFFFFGGYTVDANRLVLWVVILDDLV